MASRKANSSIKAPLNFWERSAFLLGRFLILYSFIHVTLVFFTSTWRHYHIPKTASFIFIVVLLLTCWAILAAGRRFVRSAHATPAAFFFFIILFTSLFSVNLTEAWETIIFYGACLLMSVLIPKFFVRLRDFQVLAYLVGLLSIVVSLYALAQKFDWEFFYVFTEQLGINLRVPTRKPVSFTGNENYTAEFINISFPICLMMVFCSLRRPAEMIFYSFASLITLCTIYYIDSNATYMGLAVAFPVMVLTAVHYKVIPWLLHNRILHAAPATAYRYFRHALVFGIFLGVLGATAVATFDHFGPFPNKIRNKMTQIATWVDTDGDHRPDGIASIIFRLQCMDAAIRNIVDTPVFGIGAGNFKVVHPLYESQLERKVLGEETLARKVHNDHLYHAVEHGIFGLFAWYWVIAVGIYAVYRSLRYLAHQQEMHLAGDGDDPESPKTRHMNSPAQNFYFYLQLGILGGIVTSLISCMFGHTFVLPAGAVAFWLALGLGIAVFQKLHRYEKGISTPFFGITQEALTQPQSLTRKTPSWLRWMVLFLLVLPVGAKNTYQLVGESWLKLGMQYEDQKKYQQVFYCFDRAMDIFPYQMEIYYILGRYYIDALVSMDNAIRGGDAALQQLQQMELFNYYLPPKTNATGEMQESEKAYRERALSESRESRLNRLNEVRQNLIKEGIVTLQTDLYLNPNYKWAHNNLGVIYDRLDNPYLSRAAYHRVLSIDEEQIYANYNLGIGYLASGKIDEAISALEKALAVDPGKTEIYNYLTSAYLEANDPQRAFHSANRYLSLALVEKIENELTKKASVEEFSDIDNKINEGKLSEAIDRMLQYTDFESQPSDRDKFGKMHRQYLQLAAMLVEQGQPMKAEEALKIAEKLVSVPPSQFFLMYGNIYRQVGNFEKAYEHYENYLRTNPNDINARRQIANYYGTHGNLQRAAEVYQPVLNEQAGWDDYISFAQILIAGQSSNTQAIRQHIRKAIEIGGDTTRQWIANHENGSNLIYEFVKRDPRLQELIGSKFWHPQNATPDHPQSNSND